MPDFFKVDPSDVLKALTALSENAPPFVTAYALTQTAKDIQAAERSSMQGVFERPTEFTLNALLLRFGCTS